MYIYVYISIKYAKAFHKAGHNELSNFEKSMIYLEKAMRVILNIHQGVDFLQIHRK